tara:strand:- start:15 stop:683 length:669 start_codon:yes stop_codon:yes gene_type:complete
MELKSRVFVMAVLLSLISSPMILPAQGHTASSFTVLVQENGFSQTSPEIIQNDSIVWHNIDNDSNVTHRLVYDHDGDGLYNGTFDWDSGELQAYCERDENNTKVDSNCSSSFMVIFDMNWTVGNYSYQDIRSDNTTANATIRLLADTGEHVEPNSPAIGSQFGVNNDESQDDETADDSGLTPEKMLLYVGLFTGISSLALLGLLVLRKSERVDFEHGQNEAE